MNGHKTYNFFKLFIIWQIPSINTEVIPREVYQEQIIEISGKWHRKKNVMILKSDFIFKVILKKLNILKCVCRKDK